MAATAFTRTRRDGRGHMSYTPTDRLGSDHTHLKLDVYFSKGGANVWHGTTEPRGFWLSLGAATVHDDHITETISLGKDGFGKRIFLKPAPRFNAKAFADVVATVMAHEADMVPLALDRNYHGVAAVARKALGVPEGVR